MILALALLAVQPTASEPAEPDYEELVVTAERRTLTPLPEPIEQFRQHCFDATRREGRPVLPDEGTEWATLEEHEREALRLGQAVSAVALADPARSQRLVLTAEERVRPDGLAESRCSLIIVGGRNHERLATDMARLFGTPGTSRHVGHADGTPAIPGWSHLIWTAMPNRGSNAWRIAQGSRQGSFLVVTDLRFYDNFDFVLGDLKRAENRATDVAILSVALTRRPRR